MEEWRGEEGELEQRREWSKEATSQKSRVEKDEQRQQKRKRKSEVTDFFFFLLMRRRKGNQR